MHVGNEDTIIDHRGQRFGSVQQIQQLFVLPMNWVVKWRLAKNA
jgi:hypothetical protein